MTNAFWGADASELEALARSVLAAAGELSNISGSMSSALASTTWQGPDADLFQSDWHGVHGRAVAGAVEGLRQAAAKIDFEARQQLNASEGSSNVGGTIGPLGGALAALGGALAAGAAGVFRGEKIAATYFGHVDSVYGVGRGVAKLGSMGAFGSGAEDSFQNVLDRMNSADEVLGPVTLALSAGNLAFNDGPGFVHDLMTQGINSGATVTEGLKSAGDILSGAAFFIPPPGDIAVGAIGGAIDLTTCLDPQIGNQVLDVVHGTSQLADEATHAAVHEAGVVANDVAQGASQAWNDITHPHWPPW